MKLSLVVLTAGKMEGKALDIKLSQFVIGRDPQCHLRPASPLISKRHCAVLVRDNKAFIRDFGSTNGTFLNEEPVKGEAELKHDDKLRVGPLLFAVRLEVDAPAAAAPAAKPAAKPAAAPAKAAPPKPAAAAASAAEPKEPARPAPMVVAGDGPSGTADDDIAAMLLSMQDEGDTPSASGTDNHQVPDGSTVHELQIPPGVLEGEPGAKPAAKNDKHSQAKAAQANTSAAARSILEKYLKRPRA